MFLGRDIDQPPNYRFLILNPTRIVSTDRNREAGTQDKEWQQEIV
jgi:hypothetical protein